MLFRSRYRFYLSVGMPDACPFGGPRPDSLKPAGATMTVRHLISLLGLLCLLFAFDPPKAAASHTEQGRMYEWCPENLTITECRERYAKLYGKPQTVKAENPTNAEAPLQSQFERYLAGYAGMLFPGSFSDIKGTGQAEGLTMSNINYDMSPFLGAKFGIFQQGSPFGIELEAMYLRTSFPSQVLTAQMNGVTVRALTESATNEVFGGAFNLMVRYPGRFVQPYLGVGGAVVHLIDGEATAPGLNVLAGLRGKLNDQIGLFAEFKYLRASFDSETDTPGIGAKFTMNATGLVFGVGYHF